MNRIHIFKSAKRNIVIVTELPTNLESTMEVPV
jgi:hypothetical protein